MRCPDQHNVRELAHTTFKKPATEESVEHLSETLMVKSGTIEARPSMYLGTRGQGRLLECQAMFVANRATLIASVVPVPSQRPSRCSQRDSAGGDLYAPPDRHMGYATLAHPYSICAHNTTHLSQWYPRLLRFASACLCLDRQRRPSLLETRPGRKCAQACGCWRQSRP